jgi:hypothetical protein
LQKYRLVDGSVRPVVRALTSVPKLNLHAWAHGQPTRTPNERSRRRRCMCRALAKAIGRDRALVTRRFCARDTCDRKESERVDERLHIYAVCSPQY